MTETTTLPALTGLKVLDLSRVLGGPYATQILADHGADVIKLEPPTGDETRQWGPPFRHDMASYFIGVNRNKRSIAVDLRTERGAELMLRLLEDTDVLIENLKTGTLERWGLGYHEVLAEKFPRLVYCRISGFGADGPLGGFPGYDAILQAMCGLMSVNGDRDSSPMRIGVPVVDLGCGLFSVIAVLMALRERDRSGKGQFIDMTLFDSALALMHPHSANYFLSDKTARPSGNAHPNISPYDKFKTGSCEIFLGVGNERAFRRLCEQLQIADVANDPRFASNAERVTNRDALREILEAALAGLDGEQVATRLLEQGVPAGPVLDMEQALAQAQTAVRNMQTGADDYRGVSSPIKLERTPGRQTPTPPPALSEHAHEILRQHGFDDNEIETLLAELVVQPQPTPSAR